MYTVSLLTFLRNGNFGPIVLGLKREHLDALFGPPDGWSIRRKKDNKDINCKLHRPKKKTYQFSDTFFQKNYDMRMMQLIIPSLKLVQAKDWPREQ